MFVNSFETRSAASEQGRGDHLPANLAWLQRFTELESNWRAKSKIRWHRVKFHVLNGLHTATLPRRQAFIGQVVPLTQESSSGPAILTVAGQVVVGLPARLWSVSRPCHGPCRRLGGTRRGGCSAVGTTIALPGADLTRKLTPPKLAARSLDAR